MVASRFDESGGAYVYARRAFGDGSLHTTVVGRPEGF